ncbi:MAG: hypothetical protein AB8B48_00690 [Pseudomonadales bacterium]
MKVRLLALTVCTALASCGSTSRAIDVEATAQERQVLSGEEITRAFSDVRDAAEIQDAAGTTAVNHWHGDGRFLNRWKNAASSGEVTGSWRVVGDLRCVLIRSGLQGAIGKEKCSPVYKAGERYVSINDDGSVHAFHTLTPLLENP